jgi:hypothetical protein
MEIQFVISCPRLPRAFAIVHEKAKVRRWERLDILRPRDQIRTPVPRLNCCEIRPLGAARLDLESQADITGVCYYPDERFARTWRVLCLSSSSVLWVCASARFVVGDRAVHLEN